jgi:hypothetical protein
MRTPPTSKDRPRSESFLHLSTGDRVSDRPVRPNRNGEVCHRRPGRAPVDADTPERSSFCPDERKRAIVASTSLSGSTTTVRERFVVPTATRSVAPVDEAARHVERPALCRPFGAVRVRYDDRLDPVRHGDHLDGVPDGIEDAADVLVYLTEG